MEKQNKRPIGQILLDGGFLARQDIELALEEQKQTNELLGQVLVRIGVLDPTDLKAALSVQEYLQQPEDVAKTAAGVRQLLGALLVQAGHITKEQLELALAVQRRSGEKLGEVLVQLGLLTERQLNCTLDFQQNQGGTKSSPNPLRLGEIMISSGYISREQLDEALYRQTLSNKKLGEVLIEEGYAEPHHVKHGIRLQKMLLTAMLIGALTACGSSGGSTDTYSVEADTVMSTVYKEEVHANYFPITSDDYYLLTPNFYYSSNNDLFWSIQADIADDLYDPDYRSILRIDILKKNGEMPITLDKTYSIGDDPQYEKFPGKFIVPNGEESTYNKVEEGTISFQPDSTASGYVTGSFDVILTNYDLLIDPAPQHRLKGYFSFKMGAYGPIPPVFADSLE